MQVIFILCLKIFFNLDKYEISLIKNIHIAFIKNILIFLNKKEE